MRLKDVMRTVDTILALIPFFILGLLSLPCIPFMFIARLGKRIKTKGRKVNWANPEVWF